MESYDFIGMRPSLRIREKDHYKTPLGGFLCLTMLACTISASIYFGREVWEKNNPIVNSAELALIEPIEMNLDKIMFDFMFSISNDVGFVTDPSIVNVHPTIYSYKKEKGGFYSIPFNVELCQIDDFDESNVNLVSDLGVMGTYYCIPKSEAAKGLGMYKTYGKEDFKIFNIQFFPCVNSTSSNITCKSSEEIQKALGGVYLNTFFLDSTINTNNYTNPYSKVFRNEYTTISIDSFTNFLVIYKHLYLETDNGLLFKNVIEERIPKFDLSKNYISNKPGRDGLFVEFSIQLGGTKIVYYRKYIKLQELMAQIGGIANLFMIIIYCLNYFPSKSSFKAYIVNTFFDFPGHNSPQMKLWQLSNKEQGTFKGLNLQLKPLKHPKYHILQPLGIDASNEINLSVSKFMKQPSVVNSFKIEGDIPINASLMERYMIKLSLFQTLFFVCSSKKNFSKLMISSGFEMIKEKLTIESLYSLFRAVIKLKYLLLSQSENQMFDNVGNPFITGVEDKSSFYSEFCNYSSNFSFFESTKNRKLYMSSSNSGLRRIDVLQQIYNSSI